MRSLKEIIEMNKRPLRKKWDKFIRKIKRWLK